MIVSKMVNKSGNWALSWAALFCFSAFDQHELLSEKVLKANQYITPMDTLARIRLRAEARRYGLGYLWWILEPLLYVGVFYLVFVLVLGNRELRLSIFSGGGKAHIYLVFKDR